MGGGPGVLGWESEGNCQRDGSEEEEEEGRGGETLAVCGRYAGEGGGAKWSLGGGRLS